VGFQVFRKWTESVSPHLLTLRWTPIFFAAHQFGCDTAEQIGQLQFLTLRTTRNDQQTLFGDKDSGQSVMK
jgi:hypothetical protein